jgi:hypothetical protein
MTNTIKLSCTCKSAFQDERYGAGIRIHNVTLKGGTTRKEIEGKPQAARCTVCGTVKTL